MSSIVPRPSFSSHMIFTVRRMSSLRSVRTVSSACSDRRMFIFTRPTADRS